MTDRRRGQWPVAALNGTVAGVLLLLVAVLALVVKPPAPPGIAAFAPQASKTIDKAPDAQSSAFGAGAGECAEGQDCELLGAATTTTAPSGPGPKGKTAARGVPSALQCYTWPDGTVTQTFDPQSPPCIASWDDSKGNGGATSPGVTASEIRVALPVWETAPGWPTLKPIADFYNTRFQFYGRKLTIIPFISQQANAQASGNFHEPAMQKADAEQITQLNVFASHDFIDPLHYSWSLPVFRDTLTRAKIVSIHGGEMTPYGTAADLAEHLPYEWTYLPPIDSVMRAVANMTCRQLVGKRASHAGDVDLRSMTRKFAVILPADEDLGGPMPGLSALLKTVEGCTSASPRVVRYSYADRSMSAQMGATMNQLRSDGVTSIFWFPQGGGGGATHPWSVANGIGYHPEWVMIGWNNYQVAFELQNPPSETASAFGVGTWNKQPPIGQEMWERAFQAAGGDQGTLASGVLTSGRPFYQELLLLASGIQMAGPRLTPETFAKGLQTTRFANPGAGRAPFYQGTVGFGPGDVAMIEDFNAFWLDTRKPGATVPQNRNNNEFDAMCYVNLGRRWTVDAWPTTDSFYTGDCR